MVLRRDSQGVVADREADPTAAAGSTNLWSKTAMPDALVAAARTLDQYQKRPKKERRGIANRKPRCRSVLAGHCGPEGSHATHGRRGGREPAIGGRCLLLGGQEERVSTRSWGRCGREG